MIQMHTFDDQTAQASALSQAIGEALRALLAARPTGRATLAVSGGNSPKQLLRTLSTLELGLVAGRCHLGGRPLGRPG